MAIIIELSSSFGEYLSTVVLPSVQLPNRGTVSCHCDQTKASVSCMKACSKKLKVATKNAGYDGSAAAAAASVAPLSLCGCRAGEPVSKPAGRLFFCYCQYRGLVIDAAAEPSCFL